MSIIVIFSLFMSAAHGRLLPDIPKCTQSCGEQPCACCGTDGKCDSKVDGCRTTQTISLSCQGVAPTMKYICKNPSDFLPMHDTGSSGTKCAAYIQIMMTQGQPLEGQDFSQTFDCSGKTEAVINHITNLAATGSGGCCGVGESACAVDVSHICQDPSTFLPSLVVSQGQTCSAIINMM